jgi:hypothetical protein
MSTKGDENTQKAYATWKFLPPNKKYNPGINAEIALLPARNSDQM